MLFDVPLMTPVFSNQTCIVLILITVGVGVLLGQTRQNSELAKSALGSRWDYISLGLIAALLVGGALRFYGLDFGLPDAYHPDELRKAHSLHKMKLRHTLNPNFNLHPPLLLYLSWGVSKTVYYLGFFPESGIVRNMFAGRIVSAVVGTASIYLVYLIGGKLSSRFSGLIAAVLVAVSPLHVTNSRYMKEDALFLFFVLACALAILKCVEERKTKYLYLGGLLAGFALGSKYTGLVSIVIVLSAPWLVSQRLSLKPDMVLLKHLVPALLLMPIGFLLTVPYVVVDPHQLAHLAGGFGKESRHAMGGHMGISIDPWSQLWMYHLSRSLIPGLTLVPVLIALIGVGMCFRRLESKGLFLVGLLLLFYLPAEWARSKPPPQPDRYVLACVPFFALLVGECLFSLRRIITTRGLQWLAVSMIVALPFFRTMQLATEVRLDTRKQMTRWLAENLPAGSKILTAGGTVYLARVPLKFRSKTLRSVIQKEGQAAKDGQEASARDDRALVVKLRESQYDYLLTSSFTVSRFSTGDERSLAAKTTMEEIAKNFRLAKEAVPRYGSYGFHNPTLRLFSLKERPPTERAALAEEEISKPGP